MIKIQIVTNGDVKGPWLADENEFEAALAAIAAQARAAARPQLIEFRPKRGYTLSLVVGGEDTYVVFGGRNRIPMYCHSRAETNAVEPMHLSYQGEYEMPTPRRLIIPMEQGLRAAREYLIAGKRPTCVTWEEMVE